MTAIEIPASELRNTLLCTISDVHKEAYGFRPRGYDFESMSTEALEELYDGWMQAADYAFAEEQRFQNENFASIKESLDVLIQSGAGDKETAVRWFIDSLDIDPDSQQWDWKFVSWLLDISWEQSKKLFADFFEKPVDNQAIV